MCVYVCLSVTRGKTRKIAYFKSGKISQKKEGTEKKFPGSWRGANTAVSAPPAWASGDANKLNQRAGIGLTYEASGSFLGQNQMQKFAEVGRRPDRTWLDQLALSVAGHLAFGS